ncbi:MAG: N-(5'-phosphoribosyl)anthranilate isomerase [Candidatus Zixiibacteriota bacterium]
MSVLRIKICGITRPRDARLAERLGADMIGLIFAPKSPRRVTFSRASEIVRDLSPLLARVGVFVDEEPDRMIAAADRFGLDYIQLHGSESAVVIRTLQRRRLKVIKAFQMHKIGDDLPLRRSRADMVLLDNISATQRGGTGQTFDWSLAPKKTIPNLVLSGGLTADNLSEGVKRFAPAMVDINSGVESSPGIKSPSKLKALFERYRKIQDAS